jgi:dTDP-4-dehydrorhamnose 3,5-epimerase
MNIHDIKIIERKVHSDQRGFFCELYTIDDAPISEISLEHFEFLQENVSFSQKGVARGMHIQRNNPQGKLVTCLRGFILDFAIDLRPESPTFLKTDMIRIGEPSKSIFIPPGCAHGFFAMEDSLVHYKCTEYYDPNSDGGVNMKEISGLLPYNIDNMLLTDKDKSLPSIQEWLKGRNK